MGKTALIVYSSRTLSYAKKIGRKYSDVDYWLVDEMPKKDITQWSTIADDIIAIGGGSVIDTAKIIGRKKRIIAIPTTASGACATPYATVWGKEKESIKTAKPITRIKTDIEINLSKPVLMATFFDALSHAIESFYSKNATWISKYYSLKAMWYIRRYLKTKNIYTLIKTGAFAGEAIARAKTNVVHAISYPLTIHYKIPHGIACGLILPNFIALIGDNKLGRFLGFESCEQLWSSLWYSINNLEIEHIPMKDLEMLVEEIMRCSKINDSKFTINRKIINYIMKQVYCGI